MLVELKGDHPANSAIEQIRANGYPTVLRDLGIPLPLVGITDDGKAKMHACGIENLSA